MKKFRALTPEQQQEMQDKFEAGDFKSPTDIQEFMASTEPSWLDKAVEFKESAVKSIADTVLPERTEESLSPQGKMELSDARKYGGTSELVPPLFKLGAKAMQGADKFLSERVGEPTLDLLQHPRFLAHPELAKNLNALASWANVGGSPTSSGLRLLGVPSVGKVSDIGPTTAKVTKLLGFDPTVRDIVGAVGDIATPVGLAKLGQMGRTAAAAKPVMAPIPNPYVKSEYKFSPPAEPTYSPKPVPYNPEPKVQEYADLLLRNNPSAALELQSNTGGALENTITGLKKTGLSSSKTAEKVVNSYNLPISKESAQILIDAGLDTKREGQLRRGMGKNVSGEVRTKGNLINPEEQFIMDKGETTAVNQIPTSEVAIGKPYPPTAEVDFLNDGRNKTQFQEGMQTDAFPDSVVGEAAYTTTEPLDTRAPIKGREGSQKLYNQKDWIGKPDEIWATPETQPAIGGAQKTLPIEDNPDLYKLLQDANKQANYKPDNLDPWAMEARQEKFGKVANELRDTIKKIDQPLPENLSPEDIANFERVGGTGTTGERIQNLRQDVTDRIGLQEDLGPMARNDKSIALVKRGTGMTDDAAAFGKISSEYDLPQLAEQAELLSKAEQHNKNVSSYLADNYNTSQANRKLKDRYEERLDTHNKALEAHNQRELSKEAKIKEKADKITEQNMEKMLQFSKKSYGISQKDLSRLATYSMFAPMETVLMHLAAKKAGPIVGRGILKASKYIPEYTTAAEQMMNPWKRASLIGNMSTPNEEDAFKTENSTLK